MFSFWVDFISTKMKLREESKKRIRKKKANSISCCNTVGSFLTYADTAERAVLRCLACNTHRDMTIIAVYKE